jgi:hypothetical protein
VVLPPLHKARRLHTASEMLEPCHKQPGAAYMASRDAEILRCSLVWGCHCTLTRDLLRKLECKIINTKAIDSFDASDPVVDLLWAPRANHIRGPRAANPGF